MPYTAFGAGQTQFKRAWVRETVKAYREQSFWEKFMGTGPNNIVQRITELKKTEKGWGIHLCAGDALKDAAELAKIGVPADIAHQLSVDLAAAEATADPELVKQFSLFDGVMMVDESLI
mgnify:CR=1 FL=1